MNKKRRRVREESGHNVWRSYSDMMSGLFLLFVLIMTVCLMTAQKNYTEKLAEQAKLSQSQSDLAATLNKVAEQQTELERTQDQISEQEKTLAEQASALELLQKALEEQRITLNTRESELSQAQATVESQQQAINSQQKAINSQQIELNQKESELEDSKNRLDDANTLMEQQQQRIDQIIGVKADLIDALNQEFKSNQINVQIDAQTGAILLDSSVLYEFSESTLTAEGEAILEQILPVYCHVLISGEYTDYVGEIIIDGYTDTVGEYVENLELSQQRAYAVAGYLLDNMYNFLTGQECERLMSLLSVNGKSESNPILDEYGDVDMDASRRVEIKFRLKDEEMITELRKLIEESYAAEITFTQPGQAAAQTGAAGTLPAGQAESSGNSPAAAGQAAGGIVPSGQAAGSQTAPEQPAAGQSGSGQQPYPYTVDQTGEVAEG